MLVDGEVVAAAQEERFSRKKHDPRFPVHAIRYCLGEAGIGLTDVGRVVFYDKPLVKFERLLETYLSYAPNGIRSFIAAMPVWLKEKLYLKTTLRKELAALGGCKPSALPPLLFAEHHQSHAASAFYFSPFERAAVLCLDGVGEWATTSAWLGNGAELKPLWEIDFPHSLGLLYSAFTYFTGFKVNSGEYKLMGLAPYGEPKYADLIRDKLLDLKDDGTFRLDMQYFNYCTGLTMTNDRFDELFGGPPRPAETRLTQREMDIAASIQVVTEEVVLRLARTLHRETGERYLCLAGGVALNCVANGRVLREGPFEDIWIQPAAGDAGGALGAAATIWHQYDGKPRAVERPRPHARRLRRSALRRRRDSRAARRVRRALRGARRRDAVRARLAELLEQEHVIGWFQGRMEFGPRALGGRSIIGDARSAKMQSVMNLKIKYRESFRPFAPSVLAERVGDYFEQTGPSPYMLHRRAGARGAADSAHRGAAAAVRHREAQAQALRAAGDHARRLLGAHPNGPRRDQSALPRAPQGVRARTGCGVLVNTSFNVRGEPIVGSPTDAYRCFMRTEMDYLVVENFLLDKNATTAVEER